MVSKPIVAMVTFITTKHITEPFTNTMVTMVTFIKQVLINTKSTIDQEQSNTTITMVMVLVVVIELTGPMLVVVVVVVGLVVEVLLIVVAVVAVEAVEAAVAED